MNQPNQPTPPQMQPPQMTPAPQPLQYAQPAQQQQFAPQPAPIPQTQMQPAPVQQQQYAPAVRDPYAEDGKEVSSYKRPYLKEGSYLCLVTGVREKYKDPNNTKGMHTVTVILETVVVGVQDPNSVNPVGYDAGTIYQDSSPYFLSDLKKFVGACHGMDPNTVSGQMVKQASSEAQPCTGTVLNVQVVRRDHSSKPGATYTVVEWHGAVAPEQVASLITPEAFARFFPGGVPTAAVVAPPTALVAPAPAPLPYQQ